MRFETVFSLAVVRNGPHPSLFLLSQTECPNALLEVGRYPTSAWHWRWIRLEFDFHFVLLG